MPILCSPLLAVVAASNLGALPDPGLLGQEFLQLGRLAAKEALLWIAVSQLILLLAYWIASNVVAHPQGRIGNAIKLYFLYLLTFFGIGLLLTGVTFIAGQTQSQALIFAGGCVAGLLMAAASIGLPMKVYKMGFFRGVGFVLITLLLTTAGNLEATRLIGRPQHLQEFAQLSKKIAALSNADKQRFFQRLGGRTTDSPDQLLAADRSKPIADRFAAISRIYAELEERRTKLQPGDETGKAAYARDEKNYEALLEKIQADAAQQQ